MTWINSFELESLRRRERDLRTDLESVRVTLSKTLPPGARVITNGTVGWTISSLGLWDDRDLHSLAKLVADQLEMQRAKTEAAEGDVKIAKAARDTAKAESARAKADLVEVCKVLDKANGGQVAIPLSSIYVGPGNPNGSAIQRMASELVRKSPALAAAENLAEVVKSLRAKVAAQAEELAEFKRQRDQDAVDAEYAALPECPLDGWLGCPKCAREINSAVLSDNRGANSYNPYSNDNIVLTGVMYAPGGYVTGPDAPELPQHLVWRCACGHKLLTKTREES